MAAPCATAMLLGLAWGGGLRGVRGWGVGGFGGLGGKGGGLEVYRGATARHSRSSLSESLRPSKLKTLDLNP